jgi:hypothetical protein
MTLLAWIDVWLLVVVAACWFLHRLAVTRPRVVFPGRERNRRDVADRREQAGELVYLRPRLRVVRDAVDECGDAVDASVFPFHRDGAA